MKNFELLSVRIAKRFEISRGQKKIRIIESYEKCNVSVVLYVMYTNN